MTKKNKTWVRIEILVQIKFPNPNIDLRVSVFIVGNYTKKIICFYFGTIGYNINTNNWTLEIRINTF